MDIVEVIQGYLRLNKAGTNWKGLCPFHSEKTPSFMVSQSKQMWHCFGCSQGGDVFSFVSQIEGMEFADALRLLADKAGVKLVKQDPQLNSQRQKIYEVCELATKFFERQLASKTGQAAVGYLEERGVHKKTVDYFRIGWAPDSWQSLRDFLRGEGYTDNEMAAAGLIVKSEQPARTISQTYHDRFRHRIMFPICDSQEQVIGFSGRVFEKIKGQTVHAEAGKYINTPNTLIYDKSRALFGLDKAKMAIRETGECVFVEGNLDVVLSHQAGIKNTVAPCGTAFTPDHFRTIKRYAERILLAFDADSAGELALKKGVNTALVQGFNVMAIKMPLGKDTADVVKENPELWRQAVARPTPYMQFILESTLAKFPANSLDSKKAVLISVLPFVKNIVSPLEKDFWLNEISHRIKVSKDVLDAELKLIKIETVGSDSAIDKNQNAEPEKRLPQEEYLMGLLIKYPDLKKHLADIDSGLFSARTASFLADGLAAEAGLDSGVVLASELMADLVVEPETEFLKILNNLKRQHIQKKLKTIEADIKQAEVGSDEASLELLLAEFSNLSKKLRES